MPRDKKTMIRDLIDSRVAVAKDSLRIAKRGNYTELIEDRKRKLAEWEHARDWFAGLTEGT